MIAEAQNILSMTLETYFQQFRENIIGIDQEFESPFGKKKIIYTDWTASGRLYRPIEEKLINEFGPFVANTHTETTVSGTAMTMAYHKARNIIKKHVHASSDDVLITDGTGMTGVVNKFQRILGLKIPENLKAFTNIPANQKPVVFISMVRMPKRSLSVSIIFPFDLITGMIRYRYGSSNDQSLGFLTVIFCLIVFFSLMLSETG